MRMFNQFVFTGALAILLSAAPVCAYLCLGCWSGGDPLPNLLPGIHNQSSNVTMDSCASYCAGWWLFALDGGDSCYCGSKINLDINRGGAAPAPRNSCSLACAGNANQTCGGQAGTSFELYVYSAFINSFDAAVTTAINGGAVPDVAITPTVLGSRSVGNLGPGTFSPLGCYTDGNRGFTTLQNGPAARLGLNQCKGYCSGYKYMSMGTSKYGCVCGKDIDTSFGNGVLTTGCDVSCGDDNTQTCGGKDVSNIWIFEPDSARKSSLELPSATTELSLQTSVQDPVTRATTTGTVLSKFITQQPIPFPTRATINGTTNGTVPSTLVTEKRVPFPTASVVLPLE